MEFNEGAPKLARKLAAKRAPKLPRGRQKNRPMPDISIPGSLDNSLNINFDINLSTTELEDRLFGRLLQSKT